MHSSISLVPGWRSFHVLLSPGVSRVSQGIGITHISPMSHSKLVANTCIIGLNDETSSWGLFFQIAHMLCKQLQTHSTQTILPSTPYPGKIRQKPHRCRMLRHGPIQLRTLPPLVLLRENDHRRGRKTSHPLPNGQGHITKRCAEQQRHCLS